MTEKQKKEIDKIEQNLVHLIFSLEEAKYLLMIAEDKYYYDNSEDIVIKNVYETIKESIICTENMKTK